MWGSADEPPRLLRALQARRSLPPRALRDPAPTPEQWQQAVELAARAPDHQALHPFRFVHVGPEARAALGALFAQAAADRGLGADDVDAARARAFTGPGLVAVVAQVRDDVPDVPAHEQWLCVGAAVMNLLNALHLMGFGAKVLGGSAARSPRVRQAFCDAGETLACWVICGTPAQGPEGEPEPPRRDLIEDWAPPD